MRKTILAFVIWSVVAVMDCVAQAVTDGQGVLPMVLIDEQRLPEYPAITFNRRAWDDAKACLLEHKLISPQVKTMLPPPVRVVPFAATFRVHDMTLDSLIRSQDPNSMGVSFAAPTIAYALIRSNVVLATTAYATNFRVMRHEAIHLLLWWGKPLKERGQWYGHPPEAFGPCDRERAVPPGS